MNATLEELLQTVFSIGSDLNLHNDPVVRWQTRFSTPLDIFKGSHQSDFHTSFNLPHVYDYITNLCRQQAEVIQNYENEHVCSVGQGKPDRKYRRLKLGGGQAYDLSND
jgi:hypothetical protein